METETREFKDPQPKELPTELVTQIQQFELEPETSKSLLDHFTPLFAKAQEWKAQAEKLKVTSVDQKREMQQARIARLALRDIRISADKTRKQLKEDSLRYGKAVQGVFNVIDYLITPIEKYLQEQEDFAEIQETKRKQLLKEERIFQLLPYEVSTEFYDLANMTDEAFEALLSGSRLAHENKIAEAKRQEDERIARIKAEEEERERQRQENERLKQEAIERERALEIERAAAKAERDRIEAEAKKEREAAEKEAARIKAEADARLKEQQEKAAIEQKARDEKARKEKIAADKKLKEEKEKRLALERELEAKQKAEDDARIAEENRKEAERKQREAEAAAPDKEKLLAFADHLESMDRPIVTTPAAGSIVIDTDLLLTKVVKHIREKAALI